MSLEWISRNLGARKPLMPTLAAMNSIVIGASVIAFLWSDTLHKLINVELSSYIPLRAAVLLMGMACYNFLFLRGHSLTLITIYLGGHVMFFGAQDFLAATAAGSIVAPHLFAAVMRLLFVSLLLRIWLDDFFARRLNIGADKPAGSAPSHFSVQGG